jgi:hypothetical protein
MAFRFSILRSAGPPCQPNARGKPRDRRVVDSIKFPAGSRKSSAHSHPAIGMFSFRPDPASIHDRAGGHVDVLPDYRRRSV